MNCDTSFDTLVSSSCRVIENSSPASKYDCTESTNYTSQPNPDDPIYSVVRWFNPKRAFGFVKLLDGSGDAFLHRSALIQSGIDAVEPCAVLEVRVARKDRGPYVVEVLSVDNSSAVKEPQGRQKARSSERSVKEPGTVKSFNPKKGYGFIARAGGGQ